MNRRMIGYIIGNLVQIEAAILLVPALTALFYQESCLWAFLLTALFCVVFGYLLKGKRPENVTIFSSEGYVSVALCWIVMSICGAIPLYFSGYFPNPIDALLRLYQGLRPQARRF